MPEPQTHYQVSFTSRQALAFFLGLLLSLGLAYFFGLMTGLAGQEEGKQERPAESPPVAESAPMAEAGVPAEPTPFESLPSTPSGPSRTLLAPSRQVQAAPPDTVHVFEDRAGGEAAGPAPLGSGPATSKAGFSVQVFSSSSRKEAEKWRSRLILRGYTVLVVEAPGPKGVVYRVRVGPYSAREEAERVSSRLSAEEKAETWIVPTGK